MKKLYLVLAMLLFAQLSIGQSLINNHWQLGLTDLNFTNTNPTANVVSNGKYGKASISDSSGNLLFYTNGYNVWNKNHNIMTNGGGIVSALENFDFINTVIVPNPGNSRQYYIISSVNPSCLCSNIGSTSYLFSIVEFNDVNPLGIVLNAPLGMNGGEGSTNYSSVFPNIENALNFGPLVVTKANDNNSYWVIIQHHSTIKSFKIDNNGLSLTPVISNFTNSQIYNYGSYNSSTSQVTGIESADFRITPNNTKLVGLQYAKYSGTSDPDSDPTNLRYKLYTLNFNSSTGQFSNYQELTLGYGAFISEFEISNNSNNLYLIRMRQPIVGDPVQDGEIVVKDLTNNATPVRVLNEFNTTTPSSKFSYIQKDRHGNIQVSSIFTANNRNLYLHKIDNQDSFTNSSVKVNNLSLNNNPISSLPQLIPELEPLGCTDIVLSSETNQNAFSYFNYASITAQSNYAVDLSTQDINMYARDFIALKSNTHIKSGSKYLAKIWNCSSTIAITREYDSEFKGDDFDNEENVIKLYPVPSDSKLNIESLKELKKIEIISIDGKVVTEYLFDAEKKIEIDISNFIKGIYFVKAIDIKDEVLMKKFIKR